MIIEPWPDLEAVMVVEELGDYWFRWSVYEIVARSLPPGIDQDTAEPGDWTQPEFHLKGDKGCESTPDIDKAEKMITGTIKWDGCSHFTFGPDSEGYIHLCGAQDALRLSKIIKRLFDFAAAHMTKFDRAIAGYPEHPKLPEGTVVQ